MIKKITFYFVLFLTLAIHSQEIKNYTWDAVPTFEAIPEEYKNQAAVVYFDKRWIHTRVGNYAYASFVMNHVAIKINKAEEINKYNKIKAENDGYVRNVRDFHARIIKPNGDIKILPQEKIVEVESDKIKSIVFEGVEAGDILEYYFIIKENPSSYGVEIFQKEIPVLYAEFSYTKDGVRFETFPSANFSRKGTQNKSTLFATNLPPYVEESNSLNIKNLIKIIYMVSTPGLSTNDWVNFMPMYFKKPSFRYFKKNQAREFITKLNIEPTETTEQKLLKIDAYIKENFDFVARGETAKKVTNLSEGKLKLSASDIFDLYGFTLQELKIPYKVVAGMSRFIGEVDEEKFISPLSHEFMYYIQETQKFLSPYDKYKSYGYPIYEIQGTKARTYSPLTKENYVLELPIAPADFTQIKSESIVTTTDEFNKFFIDKTMSSTGYYGQLNRAYIKYLNENKEQKDITDYLQKQSFGDESFIKLKSFTIENPEFKHNHSNTPYVIKTKSEADETLVETAGNFIIINLGKIIGKQFNLYQETERKSDIDLQYAKIYSHSITFNIPDGFQVESFKDFLIESKMKGEENEICFFKSTAKVVNNQLLIEVVEAYNAIHYAKEKYLEYRSVVNAAADFSKATVVLKPKK